MFFYFEGMLVQWIFGVCEVLGVVIVYWIYVMYVVILWFWIVCKCNVFIYLLRMMKLYIFGKYILFKDVQQILVG